MNFEGKELIENEIAPLLKFDNEGNSWTAWENYKQFTSFNEYLSSRYSLKLPESLPRGVKTELKKRAAALVEKIGTANDPVNHGIPTAIRRAVKDFDVETLSLYEKYLTKANKNEVMPQINSCVSTLRAMGKSNVSELVTADLLSLEKLAREAAYYAGETLFAGENDWYLGESLTWIAFENLSIARQLLSWVKDTKTTDMKVVLDHLPEMKASHASLCEGVL